MRWTPATLSSLELPIIMVAAALCFAAIPWTANDLGLSWDALNHQIYLGWVSEQPRFEQDFRAASYQSYQLPYLYWPAYKLALAGVSGKYAGTLLAALTLVGVPAIWLIARKCIPGTGAFESGMRMAAVALGYSSTLILSLYDTTSNDHLAAIPFLWGVAVALPGSEAQRAVHHCLLSGLLVGVASALKLSNGPLALLLPILWAWGAALSWRARCLNVASGSLGAVAGFLLLYGWWGWELWSRYGNPVFPLYDGLFEPLRHLSGWTP